MCFPGPLKRLGLTPKKDSISHLKRGSGGGVHSSLKCRDSELFSSRLHLEWCGRFVGVLGS